MTTTDHIRRCLAAIPDLMALLPDALGTRSRGPQTSRPVPGSRPPVDLDILDLTDHRPKEHWAADRSPLLDPDRKGVLPYLDDWCQDLATTALDGDVVYGVAPHEVDPVPDVPTVSSVCDWLTRHLDWAATLPQWPELADGVSAIHGRLRAATRHVRDVEDKPVPCSRCGAGVLERDDGITHGWTCRDCGHRVTVQAVTLHQAAQIVCDPPHKRGEKPKPGEVRITKHHIYDLANRPGILKPILGDTGKQRLYDLGDIRRMVAEMRLRGSAARSEPECGSLGNEDGRSVS